MQEETTSFWAASAPSQLIDQEETSVFRELPKKARGGCAAPVRHRGCFYLWIFQCAEQRWVAQEGPWQNLPAA